MAPPRESSITARIVRHLKQRGCWYAKIHGGGYARAGLPDLVVIDRGRTFWFEVKRPGGKPTQLQALEHERMRAAGAQVYVVTSWEEVEGVLER